MVTEESSGRDYRIEALSKGLRVLALFTEQQPVLRLTDVVEMTGMLMPTVFRVASTLESDGYLERMPDGSYRPGIRVLRLGFSALKGMDLVQLATGPLHALAEMTSETVNMGVLTGDRVIYLVRIKNSDLVTANIQVGSLLPAVHSSLGKALLSGLSREDLRSRISEASFDALGGRGGVSSIAELEEQLERVRKTGVAIQDEELARGLRSIAAPIRDGSGVVRAAANVAVNASDWPLDRMLSEFEKPVVDTAHHISMLLGAG